MGNWQLISVESCNTFRLYVRVGHGLLDKLFYSQAK